MKERIEYIIEHYPDGKQIFIGRSVNYNVVAQASSLDKLKHKMKVMIDMWLEHGMDTMKQTEPIDMKEITKEEWESQYKEWMKTSKWIHIADALYDTLRDLVGDNWSNAATEKYEKNTSRKAIINRKNTIG